jgi:hypothetical protein
MSLINCTECGHEVSTSALECPNCGHPLHPRMVEPLEQRTVIATDPVIRKGFPTWAFIPIGIFGALLLLVIFLVLNRNSGEDANAVNINVSAKRIVPSENRARPGAQTVTVPPASEAQTVTVPSSQTTTTTIPGSGGAPADKGLVMIDAKIAARNGAAQAVGNEKFYLLDKDLEMILSEAGLESIEGQSLMNSLGVSVLYPEKYDDFHRAALNAIGRHIKYSVQTDASGKAQIKEVKPDSYYLFGVTRTGKGFAVWSSPVTVNAGQNALNLSPQPLTEIDN